MRSDFVTSRFYIECGCRCENLLVFESYDYKPFEAYPEIISNDVSVYFASNFHAPWYKRIGHALEYIFHKNKLCWGDTVIITKNNVHQLEEIVNYFKGIKKTAGEETVTQLVKELKELGYGDYYTEEDFSEQLILGTIYSIISKVRDLKK